MSPKKVYDESGEFEEEIQPHVKQIVRTIASFSDNLGHDAIQEVDNLLSSYIENGWKLLSVQYIGNDSQGGHTVYYCLTKE